MGTYFKPVTILVACSIFGVMACHKSDDYKSPVAAEVTPLSKPTDEIKLNDPNTCDRSDDDLTPYMADASGRVIDVRDSIDTQETEVRDCDGKVTKGTGPMPVRNLKKKITIEPVQKYDGTVTAVSVGNYRTCVLRKYFVSETAGAPVAAAEPSAKKSSEALVAHLDSSGKLEVVVTDETSKFGSDLNVRDGKNVVEVTYFGKCLDGDSKACKAYEKLGSQFVLVNVDVKRPQVGGVHTVENCEKAAESPAPVPAPAPAVTPEEPKAPEAGDPQPEKPKTEKPKAEKPKAEKPKDEKPKNPAPKPSVPKK